MNVRARLKALESKSVADAWSLQGLAERMRARKQALADAPPRTAEQIEAVVARTDPRSVAHKMARRALANLSAGGAQ